MSKNIFLNKTVCVTGCLGFIGSHFVEACLEKGWRVIGVDKCTYAANLEMIDIFEESQNFLFIKDDIADIKYIPECDYIVNFAAESHVENSIIDSESFIRSNIYGVKNLLDLVVSKPINSAYRPVFVQISTDEVYGDIEDGSHVEDDILHPSNPYSASKAAADMLIFAWSRTFGIKYNIIRPTNNYGIRQFPEKLIPITIRNLMKGRKTKLHNGGEPIRNWLHASDTASGVIAVIESGEENSIYNIAGGFEQKNIDTVRSIIESFDNSLDAEDCIDFGHNRLGQDVRYSLDDRKLRSLGWKPKIMFCEEIEKIVKFYSDSDRW
jgi:dTDP-glucose 4,6-dehydratase